MNAPRYIAIQEGDVSGAWLALNNMAMTSEKSRMVIMPRFAPSTTVVPWHANSSPRRSTGIQQSRSKMPSEVCQEIQPVALSHKNVSVRVCAA
jgi:hypothetical protein